MNSQLQCSFEDAFCMFVIFFARDVILEFNRNAVIKYLTVLCTDTVVCRVERAYLSQAITDLLSNLLSFKLLFTS